MSGLPFHISELSVRRLTAFKNFLNASGAEIFSSSNAYEVLRFRTGAGTAVIYRDKKGVLKFIGPVREPWRAFTSHGTYRAREKAPHPAGDQRAQIIATLIERDGPGCFYCPEPIPPGFETIEYLIPLTSGGPNHLSNSAIAHRRCNELAGHKSLFEKIRLRDELRAAVRGAQKRAKTARLMRRDA